MGAEGGRERRGTSPVTEAGEGCKRGEEGEMKDQGEPGRGRASMCRADRNTRRCAASVDGRGCHGT